MRVALVSRDEVYPLAGGGIGQFVTAAAGLLSRDAEVTIFTASALEARYQSLRGQRDPRLPGDQVRIVFVPEPDSDERAGWYQVMQGYSAQVLQALKETYGDRGPDVIEFADFRGEAFATLQAAWALDPFLERSRVCVRLHTTAEMVEVLNGFWKPDLGSRVIHELERYSLAWADRVIWQGGDVLEMYGRFYGQGALAPAERIRYPFAGQIASADPGFDLADRPVRLLYAGRLERRKGVAGLVSAATASGRDDFRLTLVGADTDTGPLGTSVRGQLELAIADDPRFVLADAVGREQLAQLIRAHDVVVVPSLWECWPYAALEALHLNRPLLGTPVGGLTELIAEGESGWLASGTDPVSLGDALAGVLDAAGQVTRMVRSGAPLARGRQLSDEREILDGYERLARAPLARPVNGWTCESWPLVCAVVACLDHPELAPETVASLQAQTYSRLEIVVVGECSTPTPRVTVVADRGRGAGAARNLGALHGSGRYLLFLDAGDLAAPDLVARCVEILERQADVAYVTSWSEPIGDGDLGRTRRPLGNQAALLAEANVAGSSAAVFRRRVFDLGLRFDEQLAAAEDWHLHRELHEAGHLGVVIPELLLSHRSWGESIGPAQARARDLHLRGEIQARIDEHATQWIAPAVAVAGQPGDSAAVSSA